MYRLCSGTEAAERTGAVYRTRLGAAVGHSCGAGHCFLGGDLDLPLAGSGKLAAAPGADRPYGVVDILDLFIGAFRIQRALLADQHLGASAVPSARRLNHDFSGGAFGFWHLFSGTYHAQPPCRPIITGWRSVGET